MDLSALIFVALAVAWAAYLIPRALRHHEESAAEPSIETLSERTRVVASREPVDRRTARLVRPGRPAVSAEVATSAGEAHADVVLPVLTPAQRRARRAAAARAASRRRRVLLTLLAPLLVVCGLALGGVVSGWWITLPAGLLVAWLVACRLMVKGERARDAVGRRPAQAAVRVATGQPAAAEVLDEAVDAGEVTEEIAAVSADPAPVVDSVEAAPVGEPVETEPSASTPGGWDPVPAQLPTYVSKEQAPRRSVRTIDLDSTGVWTSGRSAVDAALAREADEAARTERAERAAADEAAERRRASGS